MGDPLGIGPEIIIRALNANALQNQATFLIFANNRIMQHVAHRIGIQPFWQTIKRGQPIEPAASTHNIVLIDDVRFTGDFANHKPTANAGTASMAYLTDALNATCQDNQTALPYKIDAIVTAPISKESWQMAGHTQFPGHTELLAQHTATQQHAMMFVAPQLRVILATIHIPLSEVHTRLTTDSVLNAIQLGHHACKNQLHIPDPRIAVCGLNPHASEGGIFGDEEERIIMPAIKSACANHINATGPYPADTIFGSAVDGRFDLVVAMYHDQGTIPVKLLARDEGVNVTIGLPFVRTSPDHGTAFDIAAKGIANPGSMKHAIQLAIRMQPRSVQAATI